MTSHPLVTTKQYLQERENWIAAIRRGESLAVQFFYNTDRRMRLQQFIFDTEYLQNELGQDHTYFFQLLTLTVHGVEDMHDLKSVIADHLVTSGIVRSIRDFDEWIAYFIKHKFRLVLILPEAEQYLSESGRDILGFFSELLDKYGSVVSVMAFYEANLTNPSLSTYMPSSTYLIQNVCIYPLYSDEDSLGFITYLEDKWNLQVTKKQKQAILDACGGHFWLIKEAVRELDQKNPKFLNDDDMMFRVKRIYSMMHPSEQSLLRDIVAGKTSYSPEEQESYDFFKRMNFINDEYKCTLSLFQNDFFTQTYRPGEIKIVNQKVLLNNIPLEIFFSRKEYRVFKYFIEHANKVVSRDEIAKKIWPVNTNEQYSDWAIDQLIKRLRKRLKQLYFPLTVIQTVRGQGYMYTE